MKLSRERCEAVRAGDVGGKGTIYDSQGALVALPSETLVHEAKGWDMNASSPWRRLLPGVIFVGFNTKVESRLYITSSRIVLIREIDAWREVAGDMTPLGIPAGIAKDVRLKALKAAGVRQFCEIRPELLAIVRSRRSLKRGSWLGLHVLDQSGTRFALSFWKTDGKDDKVLSIIESCFQTRGL